MSQENAEIVRLAWTVINRGDSVDEIMAELGELLHPEVEYVNPADAIERGTRRGPGGVRAALENYLAGVGPAAVFEIEQLLERGNMVFVRGVIHARGTASGVEVDGPGIGIIYTIRDNLLYRVEWHWDKDEALARFEREAHGPSEWS